MPFLKELNCCRAEQYQYACNILTEDPFVVDQLEAVHPEAYMSQGLKVEEFACWEEFHMEALFSFFLLTLPFDMLYFYEHL